jgi:hypothetical protein
VRAETPSNRAAVSRSINSPIGRSPTAEGNLYFTVGDLHSELFAKPLGPPSLEDGPMA